MAVIWKFSLERAPGHRQVAVGPGLGKAIFFGEQDGQLCVWMKVKPGEPDIHRGLQIVATGEEIPRNWRHVGSLQSGPYVWHLFQEGM